MCAIIQSQYTILHQENFAKAPKKSQRFSIHNHATASPFTFELSSSSPNDSPLLMALHKYICSVCKCMSQCPWSSYFLAERNARLFHGFSIVRWAPAIQSNINCALNISIVVLWPKGKWQVVRYIARLVYMLQFAVDFAASAMVMVIWQMVSRAFHRPESEVYLPYAGNYHKHGIHKKKHMLTTLYSPLVYTY